MRNQHSMIMALRILCTASVALPLSCGNAPSSESEEINVNPASLDDAAESAVQIERLLRDNPRDERALAALQKLLPKLDELNHLVAQVEPMPGHTVRFYETAPGVIAISESGPQNGERLLDDAARNVGSIGAIYRRLSGGAEPPPALIEAEKRSNMAAPLESRTSEPEPGVVPSPAVGSSDVGTSRQALTSEDGQWFAANGCYKNGDSRACLPNWANGGTADYYTKTSFFQIAPYSPGVLYVRLQYEGNTVVVDPVYQGDWKSWWMHSSTTCECQSWPVCIYCLDHYDVRRHRYDVLAAEGKGFHLSYAARWNCTHHDCDPI